jgi:hypothetical protein
MSFVREFVIATLACNLLGFLLAQVAADRHLFSRRCYWLIDVGCHISITPACIAQDLTAFSRVVMWLLIG